MPSGYTPIFQIFKDGDDVTGRFQDRLTRIQVDIYDGDGQNDKCKITVDDRDWRVARPFVGDRLELHLGYKEVGLAYMGLFEVNTLAFIWMPKAIELDCTSTGLRDGLKTRQQGTFTNTTLGEVVKDLAKRGGLSAMVEEGLGSIRIDARNLTSSPMHLLNSLERQFGAVSKVESGKLIFVPRGALANLDGAPRPILVFGPSHFSSGRVQETERARYRGVAASYRDRVDNVRRFIEAPTLGGNVEASAPMFTIDREYGSKEEAEASAKARAAALQRATGQLYAEMARGDPWIRAPQNMVIGSMRDGIDGSYEITRASHVYAKEVGLLTTIEAGPRGDGLDLSGQAAEVMVRPAPGATVGETPITTPQGRRQGPI